MAVEIYTFEKLEHKTLRQCDVDADDRGDYNSSPCTKYIRAKTLLTYQYFSFESVHGIKLVKMHSDGILYIWLSIYMCTNNETLRII